MFTREDLRADLQALNILPSDTLLIHSSMKSIGSVQGGADAVLDMLMEYFQKDGLLIFPTLSYRWINEGNHRFDVKNTPACTGILPELFRQRQGVVRSLHPTHSVAAFGKDAGSFTAGHENASTPAPVGSPWWKLLQRKGKIMFIGTTINCNTFLHGVDEWINHPGILTETTQKLEIVDYNGNIITTYQHRHALGRNAYYESLENAFSCAGALQRGKFGNATTYLLDAAKIAAVQGYVI